MSAGAWADAAQVQPGVVHCLTAAGGPGSAQMSADAWADFARVQPETVDHMAAVGAGAAATGRRAPPPLSKHLRKSSVFGPEGRGV